LADWLRGTIKPKAQTGGGWNKWHKQAKKDHPFRYWIAEEGLDIVQNAIWWPVDQLYEVKYYVNNRWVSRTHSLTAHPKDIKPGKWCDVGNRFLPCLFNELVDFVEIELAWSHIAWSDKEERKKYNVPFWASGWFRWRTWRCPQAGIDHLNWAKTLTNEEFLDENEKHLAEPTRQATSAMEILELYNWWKNVYPNRKDPMDASGWSEFCSRRRKKIKEEDPDARSSLFLDFKDDTENEKTESRRILDLSYEIERQQNEEDEAMLIRLIKIRNSLWT
jgi:hypothetical protein